MFVRRKGMVQVKSHIFNSIRTNTFKHATNRAVNESEFKTLYRSNFVFLRKHDIKNSIRIKLIESNQ